MIKLKYFLLFFLGYLYICDEGKRYRSQTEASDKRMVSS